MYLSRLWSDGAITILVPRESRASSQPETMIDEDAHCGEASKQRVGIGGFEYETVPRSMFPRTHSL